MKHRAVGLLLQTSLTVALLAVPLAAEAQAERSGRRPRVRATGKGRAGAEAPCLTSLRGMRRVSSLSQPFT
jgi:hypothetical protein